MSARGWSQGVTIAARVTAIALVPAAVMMLVVNLALYQSAAGDVERDVEDRGRLMSAALGEAVRYGVISGNVDSLRQTSERVKNSGQGVVAIQIQNSKRSPMLTVGDTVGTADVREFIAEVTGGAPEVNLFEPYGGPAPSSTASDQRPPVGYVRLFISTQHVTQVMRQRLAWGSAVIVAAGLMSGLMGLLLARQLLRPLQSISAAVRAIRSGDYEVPVGDLDSGELGDLQRAVHQMAAALQAVHGELERQVESRTAELQRALQRLEEANEEKRRLIVRVDEVIEAERRRISRELHDHLGSLMVAVQLQVGNLAAAARAHDLASVIALTARISEMVKEVYECARTLVQGLRPELIDMLGLVSALEALVTRWNRIDEKCRYTFSSAGEAPPILEATAIGIYRIVEEAISNVARHARASSCSIDLQYMPGTALVVVTVQDNGVGFDSEHRHQGVGLIGMRERASAVNGDLSVTSSALSGTVIRLEVPVTK